MAHVGHKAQSPSWGLSPKGRVRNWLRVDRPGDRLDPVDEVAEKPEDCLASWLGQERPSQPGGSGQRHDQDQRKDEKHGDNDALPAR